jgi:hypothetical protein
MQTSQLHPVRERLQEEPSVSTATETKRPNIQIDDLVREMTDDEYTAYLDQQANTQPLPGTGNE